MNYTEVPSRLLNLFPLQEIETLNEKYSGETSFWKIWPKFAKRMYFLDRGEVSIQNIRDVLQSFVRHGAFLNVKDVSQELVDQYLEEMARKRKWQSATYNSYISKLSSFFNYLLREGYIDKHPCHIRKASVKLKKQLTLSREQFLEILWYFKTQQKKLCNLRDNLFCFLLGVTACRRIEALNLKISDINLKQKELNLQGVKGSKPRVVPLPTELIDDLKVYLNYREKLNRSEEYLFISATKRGSRWTSSGVRKLFERLGKKLNFKITSHSFRRCAATHMAKNKMPMEEISRYLGHTNSRTTMLYIDTTSSVLFKSCSQVLSQGLSESSLE